MNAREKHLRKLNVWGQVLLASVFTTAGVYGVGVAIPAVYDSHAWERGMQVRVLTRFVCSISKHQVMLGCFCFAKVDLKNLSTCRYQKQEGPCRF
ncbi:hypothetical protein PoB_002804300 [Plakobranchus ocellatus]|uniref:Uncharacterized protein n=1 Tax=Plakobranchus ocellatus TaxID=259542 RepID=A0AAV4A2Y4_9GAST|nr:hypothetical protein PoB_002804300 [Plakobranchus ocellatus]